MGKMKEEYQDSIEDTQLYRDWILEEERKLEESKEEFTLVWGEFFVDGYAHVPSLVIGDHILCNSSVGNDEINYNFYSIFKYDLDGDGINRHYVKMFLQGERLKAEKNLYELAIGGLDEK